LMKVPSKANAMMKTAMREEVDTRKRRW